MRETTGEVAASLIATVDAALLRALGEVAGIRKPTLSPVAYGEVQLTVGCSDESSACLTAITHIAEADAIVIRQLSAEPDNMVVLRILYFDEAGGASDVRAAASADRVLDLEQALPELVRTLFEIPTAPEPAAAVAAPAEPAASPTTPSARTTTDGAPSISPLTWISMATGVAAIGTGIVLWRTADADFDELTNTRVQTRAQADDANRKFSSIETRTTLTNVLIPVGAAVLSAGAVLLAIDLSSSDSAAEASHASVQLVPLRSGAALSVNGRFGGAL
jgi:hypothetical protein